MLRRMLRLGADDGLVARVPRVEMLREANARAGFVDDSQYRALARRLRADLRVVVAIGYVLGWRIRSEVLSLERRHIDVANGTLRLDVGSTKNREGRIAYLTPELRAAVAEQLERVDELQRKLGRVIPVVFPHLGGHTVASGSWSFAKRGNARRARPGCPAYSFTTCAVPQLGTWSAAACHAPTP